MLESLTFYEMGMKRIEEGLPQEASLEFQKSIHEDPQFLDAHFELARTYRRMGRYREGLEHLDICITNLPEDFEVLREAAEIKFLAGQIEKAAPLYESLHTLDPENEDIASIWVAITLVHEGTRKGLKRVKKCLESNPTWVGGYLYLGNINEMEGHLMEAEEAYQRALDLLPDHVGALENIDRLRLGKALEVSPLSVAYDEIFLSECQRLRADGYWDQAIELMEFWQKNHPDHPLYRETLVELYRMHGEVEAALLLLRETPEKPSRLLRLEGYLLLESGRVAEAISLLDPLVEEFRTDPIFLTQCALAHSSLGNLEKAVVAAEEGIALDPENSTLWFILAKTYKSLGESEKCQMSLERTLHLEPTHPGANFAIGIEHLEGERNREAIAPLRAVVEVDPDRVEGWRHLAIALTREKEYEAAVEPWGQVVRLAPGDSQASGNLEKIMRLLQQPAENRHEENSIDPTPDA